MEDLLLDLGEERRRGSATYVRTDAGVSGPGSGGWGGAIPPAPASRRRLSAACPKRPERAGPESRRGEAAGEAASCAPPPAPRGAPLLLPGLRFL